ncbi:hypothetical protein [Thiohalorhabdus sp.]|uniref:hypothetical protein n=1 Tax=Thiohalorhabdus sp. TaxID=3094134 RepID=UPI002FC3D1D8
MARRVALALTGALLLVAVPAQAAVSKEEVAASEWKAPASVEEAAARPALHRTLAAYLRKPGRWVRLAHAGGAAGSAWAQDMRSWLITLGIPADRIQIDPGLTDSGRLTLAVHEEGDQL